VPGSDDLPEFFAGQLETIDMLRAEVDRLRGAISTALDDLMAHRPDMAERTLDRALHTGLR